MRDILLSAAFIVVWGCGDDDAVVSRDAGFYVRDAADDAMCVPYFLANPSNGDDASVGLDASASPIDAIACNMPGTPDGECATIEWLFGGGERVALAGCCTPSGSCGGMDPTGKAGCIPAAVFSIAASPCTPGDMDGGDEDAGNSDGGS